MNKILLGILVGTVLGAFDGITAYWSPEVAPDEMTGIIIGSTIKGLIAGVLMGAFARKVRSIPIGVALGLLVGFGLAYLVWIGVEETKPNAYWHIILPGSAVGVLVGFATQKYGRPTARAAADTRA